MEIPKSSNAADAQEMSFMSASPTCSCGFSPLGGPATQKSPVMAHQSISLLLILCVTPARGRTCLSTKDTTEVWTKIEGSLGSSVLLSCLYDPKLFLEAIYNNTAVIWKKHVKQHLVEIKVSDSTPKFWGSWSSRLETFTSLAKTGNFSIIFKTMNQEDVGNFSCSLYDGMNCMMRTQGISLALRTSSGLSWHQALVISAGVSGFALLLVTAMMVAVVVCRGQDCRRRRHDECTYANVAYTKKDNVATQQNQSCHALC